MLTRLLLLLLLVPFRGMTQGASLPAPAAVRMEFRRLLQQPKVSPEPQLGTSTTDSMVIERGSFTSAPGERVPLLIFRPAHPRRQRLPVVICLHGTGGSKDGPDIRELLIRLTQLGFMGVAIDGRFHGERAGVAAGTQAYTDACTAAWENNGAGRQTHPFFYDNVYDVWRLIDYLVSRPDTDSLRIGLTGISKGGIETWMAAATDTRIRVVVPVIAVQSFRWSLEHDRWQGRAHTIWATHERAARDLGDSAVNRDNVKKVWDKLLPGITGEFDCPSMLRLIAPRPLLILSTELDANCPLPGALIAYKSAKKAYAEQHAQQHLFMDVEAGQSHRFTDRHREMALAFFKKWL